MITNNTFNHLLLLGRPASGKSEFIDYMKHCDVGFRRDKHFIGNLAFVDDFVWLWKTFEDDDIWEKVTGKRLFTRKVEEGYNILDANLYDFMIEKFNRVIQKEYLTNDKFYEDSTLIVEFSRGGEKSYTPALNNFDKEILSKTAILYVQVSGDESKRRNEARYQEKMKDSILAHKVPDYDMKRIYSDDDWNILTEGRGSGFINLNGIKVPFVTMNNEPESKDPKVLAERYGEALASLYEITPK